MGGSMTKETFQAQVKVLGEVWGNNNYSVPVTTVLWRAFGNVPDDIFIAAVDHLLATRPARKPPPLLEELTTSVERAKVRANSQRYFGNAFGNVLDEAANKNRTADPEFVQACLKHVRSFMDRKINYKTFLEGCDYLDSVAAQLNPERTRQILRDSVRENYSNGKT